MATRIKRHFIFLIDKRRTRRTYGGCNYRGRVYENRGRGKLNLLGEFHKCTSSHMGEDSEAWSLILMLFPSIGRTLAKAGETQQGYYSWQFREKYGYQLDTIMCD